MMRIYDYHTSKTHEVEDATGFAMLVDDILDRAITTDSAAGMLKKLQAYTKGVRPAAFGRFYLIKKGERFQRPSRQDYLDTLYSRRGAICIHDLDEGKVIRGQEAIREWCKENHFVYNKIYYALWLDFRFLKAGAYVTYEEDYVGKPHNHAMSRLTLQKRLMSYFNQFGRGLSRNMLFYLIKNGKAKPPF